MPNAVKSAVFDYNPALGLYRHTIWLIQYKLLKMINQHEIYTYIEDAFPEIKEEMVCDKKDNPYTVMGALSKLTAQKTKEHNYAAVKKCLDIADKLYYKGNNVVKNAVGNVYVYSFTNIFPLDLSEKRKLLAIMPIALYTLYINQLYQHGC